MNNTFEINYSDLLERIKELTDTLSDCALKLKDSFSDLLETLSNEDNKKYSKEDLDKLTLEEIEELIFLYKGTNPLILRKILNYYTKRIQIQILNNALKSYKKILKKLQSKKNKFLQNKRDIIRKIYSFLFKNLDDTHTITLFN